MKLELINVSRRFADKVILNNFSFSFEESGLYIVTGESGIGKTTLLRIIAGLDTDYQGEVLNGGISNSSFMFQEYRLFPTLNATKNAAIASKSASVTKASEILLMLGFAEGDLKKKPHELSGGMKQRVAFARALLKDSPILILDEPTKELDEGTVNTMLSMIDEEAKKRLVIIVTHDKIYGETDNSRIIKL